MCVEARAPPGKALVWANSTSLRLNLLAWGGRCPVAAWSVAVRAAAAGARWLELDTDGETAEVQLLNLTEYRFTSFEFLDAQELQISCSCYILFA